MFSCPRYFVVIKKGFSRTRVIRYTNRKKMQERALIIIHKIDIFIFGFWKFCIKFYRVTFLLITNSPVKPRLEVRRGLGGDQTLF